MKTLLHSTWMKAGLIAVLAVAVAFAALSIAPSLALAQTPGPATPATPQNPSPQAGAVRKAALEKAFARENTAAATQAANLQKIGKVATNAQALITKAQSKGWNVTDLQAALNTFNTQIANAQSLHDTAAGILSTHTGFDAGGKVVEVTGAAQTVRDAHQSLADARRVMRQSAADLRTAIRIFRNAHR